MPKLNDVSPQLIDVNDYPWCTAVGTFLVVDTYCYAPLYQPYIYLQHRTKKKITLCFFPICIKYIIYIVFSKQKSTFFSYVDCKWCSFKHWGEQAGFYWVHILHTAQWFVFIASFYLASVLSRWESVCDEQMSEEEYVRLRAHRPLSLGQTMMQSCKPGLFVEHDRV